MSALQEMIVQGSPTEDQLRFHVRKCESCGAPVIPCRNAKGKLMRVDAKPTDEGTVELHRTRRGLSATFRKREPLFDAPRLMFTSHFATCPNAKKHRKRR